MNSPSECWSMLSKPAPEQLLSTIVFGQTKSGKPVFLGRDSNDRLHCYIPVSKTNNQFVRKSKAVWLVPETLELQGQPQLYADLVCIDSTLLPIFELLVNEVLRRVALEEDSLLAVLSTLGDWRALLDTEKSAPSSEKIKGLRGELEILHRLVLKHGASIVEKWRGPYGTTLDFLGSTALEVKTTTAQSGAVINVHDLQQLTPPKGQSLSVIHIRLEENESGTSVRDLVGYLLNLGCDRNLLFEGLGKVGYDENQHEWSRCFEVLQICAWYVTEDFPGLRETRISNIGLQGVKSIHYQLDLSSAGTPVSGLDVEILLEEFSVGEYR